MKKTNFKNSAFRNPLNDILGSKGHILILRELITLDIPINYAELIERTNLSRQGLYDVVDRLIETGALMHVGIGKQKLIQLRTDHPLSESIINLFTKEKKLYHSLLKELKEVIKNLDKQPKSAWIFGKIAQGTDEYGDPVQVAILGDMKSIDIITENFREKLYHSGIEQNYDITIDLRGITKADLETRSKLMEGNIILLYGVDPRSYLENLNKSGTQKRKKHTDFDARSLSDAEIWTKLLKKYPEIISKTLNHLENRIPQVSSGERKELQEWKHILESMSFQRLKKFLESDSERSVRLRQSLPFWEVLNERERSELMNTSK